MEVSRRPATPSERQKRAGSPQDTNDALSEALATTNFLEAHKVRENPINFKADKVSEAFGDQVYTKITEGLSSPDTNVRTNALDRLNDLVWDADNLTPVFNTEVFNATVTRLQDEESSVRRRATKAVARITTLRAGRMLAIEKKTNITPNLASIIADTDDEVRVNVYKILDNMAQDAEGLARIIQENLVQVFIQRIGKETNPLKVGAIGVLERCCKDNEGYAVAMAHSVVQALKDTLATVKDNAVATAACQCISAIAYHFDGKDACVNYGTVPFIVKRLRSPITQVLLAATTALMNIAICQLGKVAIFESDGLVALITCALDSENPGVIAACLQAVASTVEYPAAKQDPVLSNSTTTAFLASSAASADPLIKRSAKLAKEKIEWTP